MRVSLSVNESPIQLEYFMQSFIYKTVAGMLSALRGSGEIQALELAVREDEQVDINLNNTQLPVNEFISKVIRNTITGMVSTLKGVSRINSLKITITR